MPLLPDVFVIAPAQQDVRKGRFWMKKYIGTKLVEAAPAYKCISTGKTFAIDEMAEDAARENGLELGYLVQYPDGYRSWSPKDTFEKAYLQIDNNKDLPSGVSIGHKMIEDFISEVETVTMGGSTTVVRCSLRNGFVIVESSSCVDPRNYSEKVGREICMNKIEDKIWELLGFLMQTAWHGVQ